LVYSLKRLAWLITDVYWIELSRILSCFIYHAITYLRVFSFLLWRSIRHSHKEKVGFVFIPLPILVGRGFVFYLLFIYTYWCPTRFLYHMYLQSLKRAYWAIVFNAKIVMIQFYPRFENYNNFWLVKAPGKNNHIPGCC
jgi:uncharacterized membrane protein